MKLLTHFFDITRQALALPAITVSMSGDDAAFSLYRYFKKPHPTFRVIQNKRWGVGLLEIPTQFQDYLSGHAKQAVRSNRNKALKSGFRFVFVDPLEHIDEILAVNRSAPNRQGRKMNSAYLIPERLRAFFADKHRIAAILSPAGNVRAYAVVTNAGDLANITRLLGHQNDLEAGIMYLLVSEVIREMSEQAAEFGQPRWLMYDTMLAPRGKRGLNYFKERMGFQPYRVRWKWGEKSKTE